MMISGTLHSFRWCGSLRLCRQHLVSVGVFNALLWNITRGLISIAFVAGVRPTVNANVVNF